MDDHDLMGEIDKKIDGLSRYYSGSYKKHGWQNGISLYNGRAGATIIQALIYEVSKESNVKAEIKSNIEFLINALQKGSNILSNHCNGVSGLGWLFLKLKDKELFEFEADEILEEFDEVLGESVTELLSERNFDLLHGAMGIGVYFLRRNIPKPVETIVEALYEDAVKDSIEVKWSRYDKYNIKDHIFDLGLAHGNAGILYFLLKAYRGNVQREKCREMMLGGINFLMNNIQDHKKIGSFYNSSILVSEYKTPGYKGALSRLGWCYGDLGILYVLFIIAKELNLDMIMERVERMFESTALRRTPAETYLRDSSFCHGASGVGYIFLLMYKLTKNNAFKDATNYWMKFMLDQGIEPDGIEGYLFDTGEEGGWLPINALLTGAGGVELFLLSYRYQELSHDWNECFFLS